MTLIFSFFLSQLNLYLTELDITIILSANLERILSNKLSFSTILTCHITGILLIFPAMPPYIIHLEQLACITSILCAFIIRINFKTPVTRKYKLKYRSRLMETISTSIFISLIAKLILPSDGHATIGL